MRSHFPIKNHQHKKRIEKTTKIVTKISIKDTKSRGTRASLLVLSVKQGEGI